MQSVVHLVPPTQNEILEINNSISNYIPPVNREDQDDQIDEELDNHLYEDNRLLQEMINQEQNLILEGDVIEENNSDDDSFSLNKSMNHLSLTHSQQP